MSGAKQFFDMHLAPAIEEWRSEPASIRRAMIAAEQLNILAERYWHEHKDCSPAAIFSAETPRKLREALARRCPEFGIIRDVAEAHKHLKLDRLDRFLTSAGQTTSYSLGWGEAEYGQDEWGGTETIVVKLDDGTIVPFRRLVEVTVRMWGELLAA